MIETTLEAYKAVSASGVISSMQEKVLSIVEAYGEDGCISEEVLASSVVPGTHINTGTITTRLSELERKGLIYRAGDTRNASSGRKQVVWRHIKHSASKPTLPVEKKPMNGFDKGVIYCAKMIAKASDLKEAKKMILMELEKIKDKT
jgi:hypothetical protein